MEFSHPFSVQDIVIQEQPDVMVLQNSDGLAALHRATLGTIWEDSYYQCIINQGFSFAVLKNILVGACLCQRLDADTGEILFIGVLPSWRRRGWAKAILQAVMNIAKKEGITLLYLEVEVSNIPAQTLYASMGGKQVGIRRDYYGYGRDAQTWVLNTSYQRSTPAP